ncbi:MAG: hypothetical protein AAF503_14960 [Pseudomonadota bacterium]
MTIKALLALGAVTLAAACAEYPIFEDRSSEVTITHRVPNK